MRGYVITGILKRSMKSRSRINNLCLLTRPMEHERISIKLGLRTLLLAFVVGVHEIVSVCGGMAGETAI